MTHCVLKLMNVRREAGGFVYIFNGATSLPEVEVLAAELKGARRVHGIAVAVESEAEASRIEGTALLTLEGGSVPMRFLKPEARGWVAEMGESGAILLAADALPDDWYEWTAVPRPITARLEIAVPVVRYQEPLYGHPFAVTLRAEEHAGVRQDG